MRGISVHYFPLPNSTCSGAITVPWCIPSSGVADSPRLFTCYFALVGLCRCGLDHHCSPCLSPALPPLPQLLPLALALVRATHLAC